MKKIYYRKGSWKYQLAHDFVIDTGITGHCFYHSIFKMDSVGTLTIKSGYSWDGCSGPTWDDDTNMVAGLVHDALYQAMRLGLIPTSLRGIVDKLFLSLLTLYGMGRVRRWLYYKAVDKMAAAHVKDSRREEIHHSPK